MNSVGFLFLNEVFFLNNNKIKSTVLSVIPQIVRVFMSAKQRDPGWNNNFKIFTTTLFYLFCFYLTNNGKKKLHTVGQ